ncbi:MAG TPA: MBL fold metallo-hydrolase [Candidatus Acidoferrales bacterium]|nr:MBL fold metallo-hydrolase [Candidatus Acidoferrales bacterium]
MSNPALSKIATRREILRAGGLLIGGGLIAGRALSAFAAPQQATAPQTNGFNLGGGQLAKLRAQMAATPLQTQQLGENIHMLFGPGGNMVVLDGADGKVLVDASLMEVAPKVKAILDGMGGLPLKLLINTHWHWDHTDGNAAMHGYGATILAHENTRKRLSTPQEAFGAHFDPSPAAAWPQQTFADSSRLYVNGEDIEMRHFLPAHTDSDIYVYYHHANVFHAGDTFFNGFYPVIDASTGGNIDGMIGAASHILGTVDSRTKIVPGHGPLGDRASLEKYFDMLVTVRDRLKALKTSGKTVAEAVMAKPTADLDETWAKGLLTPDVFVSMVYPTI